MTFVLTVQTKGSLWLLADRRLSAPGRAPIDDACKVAIIETHDGTALIGYAGLGATAFGTEPSKWISNVLRGTNVSLEQSLGLLANAMKREFVPHLRQIRGGATPNHNMVVSAFVGNEHRIYTIDLTLTKKDIWFRHTQHIMGGALIGMKVAPSFAAAGSGVVALTKERNWKRPLLHLVRAYNEGLISPSVVSDHLANLNYRIHQNTSDGTVGPRSLVVWRNAGAGYHKGGGGHHAYTALARDHSTPFIPTIARGMDINAISNAILDQLKEPLARRSKARKRGEAVAIPTFSEDEVNAKLAKLPSKPDEKLR